MATRITVLTDVSGLLVVSGFTSLLKICLRRYYTRSVPYTAIVTPAATIKDGDGKFSFFALIGHH